MKEKEFIKEILKEDIQSIPNENFLEETLEKVLAPNTKNEQTSLNLYSLNPINSVVVFYGVVICFLVLLNTFNYILPFKFNIKHILIVLISDPVIVLAMYILLIISFFDNYLSKKFLLHK